MSSFSANSTLTTSVLEDLTQPDLIKFEVEYSSYKENVADLNRSRDTSTQLLAATILQCLHPVLLQSLCPLGQKIVTVLDRNNASELIDHKYTAKSLIWKLVQNLESSELRERIGASRGCWTGEQKPILSIFGHVWEL